MSTGLDKQSKAEIEMFVRTSSLVESQLEETVQELRKDEYLGDASWPVVWRHVAMEEWIVVITLGGAGP